MIVSDLIEASIQIYDMKFHDAYQFTYGNYLLVLSKNKPSWIISRHGFYDLCIENIETGLNIKKYFVEDNL